MSLVFSATVYKNILQNRRGLSLLPDPLRSVSANTEEAKATIIADVLKNKTTQVKQIQINNVTFNIIQADNLTVRNAIEDIPRVSWLLSRVDIKAVDILAVNRNDFRRCKVA